ncbi:MAG TPA: AAA family ATPase [Bacteroidaceae bacterium]|nr:AAA family ATPase [Bacteroidaceae bacterium]
MTNSISLKVTKLGPIKHADVIFDKYTVFIGNQGAGKSTLAKIFSLFVWLEKALIRHYFSEAQLCKGKFSNKEFCKYHRITSYFKPDTEIEFKGKRYTFEYNNEKLRVTTVSTAEENGQVAKVIYIPAERNLLSTIEHPRKLEDLPSSLLDFNDEYDNAKNTLNNTVGLPVNRIEFVYDKLNDISWVQGEDFKTRLTEASSGFQSLVPLCLVSSYLTLRLLDKPELRLSKADKDKLNAELEAIMSMDVRLDVKEALIKKASAKFGYSSLVNVVEEMEQNLYPTSQKEVLFYLLNHCNSIDENRLVLTTHSPYLINYLSLAAKAKQIASLDNFKNKSDLQELLYNIVPKEALLDSDKLHIYEVRPDGQTVELEKFENLPSDDNVLNTLLGETNELFSDLYDIEEACQV